MLSLSAKIERRIEVIANGLPLWGGVQLAVDTTLVSPLTAAGAPRRARGCTTGAALRLARQAKERTYPELCRSARSRLTVLALEVGGRWSAEAAGFVRQLARCRARAAPATAGSAATSAYALRWSALISFAATRAFCASLLALPLANTAMSMETSHSSAMSWQTARPLLPLPAACRDRAAARST